jgi:hypothetical protein
VRAPSAFVRGDTIDAARIPASYSRHIGIASISWDHVRRGDHRGDHEDPDHRVAAAFAQLRRRDPAQQDQDHQRHRQLERQPEGQEEHQHEIEVAADVGHHRHPVRA